ncbi:MAG: hypothetical protein K8F52_01815 [Candidatus Scalindua rubra]|uniref:HEPN domain-containing protein n=1 Tax=Candidatus Scalindua brodae TaxID=237368 RepID=A0A0B0ELX6_9BACT|nr:MAG: hypothetical protein SCABRO_02184 [Candidatus Scalindua brodae]MBZ0107379.1 hypothetical protein [Candidatus Scalindua rubra]TWU31424.1 hypothetical protein S225a_20960 [Candidatus Brocadiaceae bacterium S225]
MSEYRIGFAQKLSETSESMIEEGLNSEDAQRAVLYISCVSCEIALKAALEKAGKTVPDIRRKSHNLSSLLKEVCSCTVLCEVTKNKLNRVRATDIRGVVVDSNFANATVGQLLEAEENGASKFPNEIRYGEVLKHFPAPVMSKLSIIVVAWVRLHWSDIQA